MCKKYINVLCHTLKEVKNHLFVNKVNKTYKVWHWHREKMSTTYDMVHDLFTHGDGDYSSFTKLLEDIEMPLYLGYTKYNILTS